MQQATVDSLRMLQNDNMNLLARDALPRLLSYVSPNQLSDVQLKALAMTRSWNLRNDPQEVGATVFSLWWNDLMTALWEDDFPTDAEYPVRYPTRDRTLKLILDEPDAKWVDNVKTPDKETLALLCTQAFRSAVDTLAKYHGETINEQWQWASHKATYIPHLTRQIKPFGRYNLPIGGGRNIVNATSERNGPSWRMVVALGPQVKGYGVYPGGQSGNPGSYYYDNMVDTWAQGNLNELLFLRKPDEATKRVLAKWELEK
jgi:penicillin amidase